MTEHFMERMTWKEVEARLEAGVDAVILPIGTTEQHGPHMPLDTDCIIARSLAERVAAQAEADGLSVLVAPTLNVTLSWYHMQFPGSMRLSTPTFLEVFKEVVESLHHHGIRNVIALNGHDAVLRKVAEESTETLLASKDGDKLHVVREMADLWFHSMVLLAWHGLNSDDVLAELERREGISGIDEKAARK